MNLNPMFNTSNEQKNMTRTPITPLNMEHNHKSSPALQSKTRPMLTLKPQQETIQQPKTAALEEKKQRKVRSDKTHDIKFPVTEEMRAMLRRISKKSGVSPTKNNTLLLRKALQIPPHQIPDCKYTDTGTYMHAKPNQIEYGLISELAIKWGLSERRALYRLMVHILDLEARS